MAILHESLSRAVSSVDLKAALIASQSDTNLSLRLKSHTSQHDEISHEAQNVPSCETVFSPKYPIPPPTTPAEFAQPTDVDADLAEDELNEAGVQVVPSGAEAPRKKKKKSSGKNKKPKPTGFEEFYADPPVTPAEFKEESELYHEGIEFYQRIEACIQRYRARRNLDSTRSNILTKYLMLGGVDSTVKAFTGGLDRETLDNSNADEIRAMNATDYLRSGSKKYYDPKDDDHWVVDFEGVAKGFFSYRIPQFFPMEREADIKLYCSVIRNFLNYVLAHNVCLEYTLDIMAARGICNKAEIELVALNQFRWAFPGDFNMAASTLYGGQYKGMHVSTHTWEHDDPGNTGWVEMNPGMSNVRANRIFQTAIALEADEILFSKVRAGNIHVVSTQNACFEVVRVVRATEKSISDYASVKDVDGIAGNIKALGVMVVKPWEGPGFVNEDSSDDEGDNDDSSTQLEETAFWIEDDILAFVFLGLKMELTVHELNIGLKYFDTLSGPYCSFYTALENERMVDWKEPVPNTRPAPTEDNPDAEEAVFNAEIDGDVKQDEKISFSNEDIEKAINDATKNVVEKNETV